MDEDLKAIRAAQYKRSIGAQSLKRKADVEPVEAKKIKVDDLETKDLSVLSWNVDGLDSMRPPKDMALRTFAVFAEIERLKPDVVFLQELTAVNWRLFQTVLNNDFELLTQQNNDMGYFVAAALRREKFRVLMSETINFETSKMGRGLLAAQAEIKSNGDRILLATSHLESEGVSAKERMRQLVECWKFVDDTGLKAIFGGDMNARDKEVSAVREQSSGLKQPIDAWEALGSPRESQFTWDTFKNDNLQLPKGARCRFDRLYLWGLQPTHFALVGTERIEDLGRYPSDHFGIYMRFENPS